MSTSPSSQRTILECQWQSEPYWTVSRYTGSDYASPLFPEGMPLVVDRVSGKIFEPSVCCIFDTLIDGRINGPVKNSIDAAAYDHVEWISHLDFLGISWQDATMTELIGFGTTMRSTYSNIGQRFRAGTINRRNSSARNLAIWAGQAKTLIPSETLSENSLIQLARNGDPLRLERAKDRHY